LIALPHTTGSVLTDVGEPTVNRADIPSLDGLRAVSIGLVLVGHALNQSPRSFGFRALFLHADLGVRVFFVISGFLITSLLLNERTQSGSISLKLFYIRRALRILPAFFLFIGCVALLSVLGVTPVPSGSWLFVLTYTVNFAPYPPFALVLLHLWSLSVEEQFYLLWPLVIKSVTPRTCAAIAVLAIFGSFAVHALHRLSGSNLPGYAPFPIACGPIAMGCLLAMWARKIRCVIVSSKLLSDYRLLLLTLLLIALFDAIPNGQEGAASVFLGIILRIITNFLLTFCVARLVYIPTGLAGRALNSAPFVLIGKLSYSLYLWQQPFTVPFSSNLSVATLFPVNFVLTLAAASASYWGVEVRFLRLRKKFRTATATHCERSFAQLPQPIASD